MRRVVWPELQYILAYIAVFFCVVTGAVEHGGSHFSFIILAYARDHSRPSLNATIK